MPSTSGSLFQDPSIQQTFEIKDVHVVTEVDTSDDFGFSTIEPTTTDPTEPSYEEAKLRFTKVMERVDAFLTKLAKNPEKDIHWPNRDIKIEEFKKQLYDILDGR